MKQILLFAGIVLSVLFVVFSSQVYELIYYNTDFSESLYNTHMYRVIAILTVFLTWGIAAVYYYLIDSIRFSRWWHWLIMLLCSLLLAPTATIIYQNRELPGYANDVRNFAVASLAVTLVLFLIASFSIRWWSKQCRHTPIPQ
jgi:hypothetical protein